MPAINNILVPTDFSATAGTATATALFLAGMLKSDLTFIHARVMYGDDTGYVSSGFSALESIEKKMESNILAQMQIASGRSSADINITHEIVRGHSVAPALLDYLSEAPVDLVVMGTHGQTGSGHFVIGSVAEKIVRYAPCPVLTVREECGLTAVPHHLVVPFDFSAHSRLSFEYAVQIARVFNATVHLLYVVDLKIHPSLSAWGVQESNKSVPQIAEKAKLNFEQFLAENKTEGVAIETHIRDGMPHKEITVFGEKGECDLIVIATQALAGMERVLLGSTTEKVLRSATCPVLTLKSV